MSAAKVSAPPSPVAPASVDSPTSIEGPPREKSAHPSAAATRNGTSTQQRDGGRRSELIRHVEAQDVVGDLIHLLEVDEVEDPEPEAPGARHDPEVVGRAVGAREARVVHDQPAHVVEGEEARAVLQEHPVYR